MTKREIVAMLIAARVTRRPFRGGAADIDWDYWTAIADGLIAATPEPQMIYDPFRKCLIPYDPASPPTPDND